MVRAGPIAGESGLSGARMAAQVKRSRDRAWVVHLAYRVLCAETRHPTAGRCWPARTPSVATAAGRETLGRDR